MSSKTVVSSFSSSDLVRPLPPRMEPLSLFPQAAPSAVEELATAQGKSRVEAYALNHSVLQTPYAEEQEYRLEPYRQYEVVLTVLGVVLASINWCYCNLLRCLEFVLKYTDRLTQDRKRLLARKKWLGVSGLCTWLDNREGHWERVRMGVTTYEALDVLYAKEVILPYPPKWGEGRLAWIVLTGPEPQAVTNRLKITAKRIFEELERLYQSGKREITFAALASGSAQAVIETVARFQKKYPDAKVKLTLVDMNLQALEMAKKLAAARSLVLPEESFCHMHLIKFLTKCLAGLFDIVEMVGFLDYRTVESLKKLCKEIWRVLKPGGLFLTAHIAPSPHAFRVRWDINWPDLVRRPPDVVRKLLTETPFKPDDIEIELERHGIHAIAQCRKEG